MMKKFTVYQNQNEGQPNNFSLYEIKTKHT